MKKIFTYLGFISLICFSFILTEKTSNLLIDNDELMMTIKSSSNNYEIEPIDGIILDNTFIPGINGLKVDNKKSYKEMKNYGVFNEGLLEFKQVSPKNKLNDNYDKYIISGNSNKKMVSLIFLVEENNDINTILKILEDKNIKANFFVDGFWFEDNNEMITTLINNNHVVGNLSYNLNYNDGAYIWMDTIIKKVGGQNQGYCYAEEENIDSLKICTMNKNYTIKPNIIVKDNYLTNIKMQLTSGSIISLKITNSLEQELPVIINYIKSKGYEINNLNILLSEERLS